MFSHYNDKIEKSLTPSQLEQCGFLRKNTEATKIGSTDVETGDPHLEKLANGDPDCWKIRVPEKKVSLKQEIVITDFSLRVQNTLDFSITNWISWLIRDHYKVYVWTDSLIPITALSDLYNHASRIQPVSQKTIFDTLEITHVRRDHIKIVDFFERVRIETFLQGKPYREAALPASFLLHQYIGLEHRVLDSLSAKLPLTLDLETEDLALPLTKILLNLPQVKNLQLKVVGQVDLKDFYAVYGSKIKYLTLKTVDNWESMPFHIFTNLHTLSLINCKTSYHSVPIPILANLKNIHVKSCDYLVILKLLTTNAPEALLIESTHLNMEELQEPLSNLQALRTLSVHNSTPILAKKILKNAHALETLELKDLITTIELDQYPGCLLKNLSLWRCKTDLELYWSLIEPRLETLTVDKKFPFHILNLRNLPNLRSLSILSVSHAQLKRLLIDVLQNPLLEQVEYMAKYEQFFYQKNNCLLTTGIIPYDLFPPLLDHSETLQTLVIQQSSADWRVLLEVYENTLQSLTHLGWDMFTKKILFPNLTSMVCKSFSVQNGQLTINVPMAFAEFQTIVLHPTFTIDTLVLKAMLYNHNDFSPQPFVNLRRIELSILPLLTTLDLLPFMPNLIDLQVDNKDIRFCDLGPALQHFRLEKFSLYQINKKHSPYFSLLESVRELSLQKLPEDLPVALLLKHVPQLEHLFIGRCDNPQLYQDFLTWFIEKKLHKTLNSCQLPEFKWKQNQLLWIHDCLLQESDICLLLKTIDDTESLIIDDTLSFEKSKTLLEKFNLSHARLTFQIDNETVNLADIMIHLLDNYPVLGRFSIRLYQKNDFFILHNYPEKSVLKTNIALSSTQLGRFLSTFPLADIRMKSLHGPLTPHKRIIKTLQITNHQAFQEYLPLFSKVSAGYQFRSSEAVLSEQQITLHNLTQIPWNILQFHIGNLYKKQIKILSLHFPLIHSQDLGLNLIDAFPTETIELIVHTVEVQVIQFFFKYFLSVDDDKRLIVKNADQQLLFKICRSKTVVTLSGPMFTQEIIDLLRLLNYTELYFQHFHFVLNLRLPPNQCERLYFIACDVTKDFFIHLPMSMGNKYPLSISLDNCPFLHKNELKGLFQQCHIAVSKKPSEDKSSTQEESNQPIDAYTGEQILENNFLKKETPWFTSITGRHPLPNYLRFDVITKCKRQYVPISIPRVQNMQILRSKFVQSLQDTEVFITPLMQLHISADIFSPIPALTPADTILFCFITGFVDFYYSPETNQYYVHSKINRTLEFAFIVKATIQVTQLTRDFFQPYESWFPCLQSLDPYALSIKPHYKTQLTALHALPNTEKCNIALAFCASFETLDLSKSVTPENRLKQIFKERRGVCRHKTEALRILIDLLELLDIRIVESQNHTFAEQKVGDTWHMLCLGGARMPTVTNQPFIAAVTAFPTVANTKNIATTYTEVPVKNPSPTRDKPCVQQPEKNTVLSSQTPEKILYINPQKYYPNPFNHPVQALPLSVHHFPDLCEQIIAIAKQLPSGEKNILLQCDSQKDIEQLQAYLATLISKQHHFIAIESLNHLQSQEIHIHDNRLTRPVFHTINELHQAQKGDVCLVNISDYESGMINTINALVDTTGRTIAGLAIPDHLIIIAVTLKTTILEIDLLSRFKNHFYEIPSGLPAQDVLAPFCREIAEIPTDSLDFYTGESWLKHLPGTFQLQGKHLVFAPGALFDLAVQNYTKPFYGYNLPLQKPDCRFFLINLFYTGRFYAHGKYHAIHPDFRIYHAIKTPNLTAIHYSYHVEPFEEDAVYDLVLNHTSFFQFFHNYVSEAGNMVPKDGWFKSIEHTAISILITELLDPALFAQLLDGAHRLQKHCIFIFAPTVPIPETMATRIKPAVERQKDRCKNRHIVSNDKDFTEALLLEKSPEITVIPIHQQTSFVELFGGFNTQSLEENQAATLPVTFTCGLVHDLVIQKTPHTVLLKGQPSLELLQKIQTLFLPKPRLFLNNETIQYPGNLILLTEESLPWPIPAKQCLYTCQDYRDFLQKSTCAVALSHWQSLYETFLGETEKAGVPLRFNFNQYEKMYRLHRQAINPFLPFLRLQTHHEKLAAIALSIYPETTKTYHDAAAFRKARTDELDLFLNLFQGVFIEGNSHAGKSTFARQYRQSMNSHIGMANKQQWIEKKGLFFLDNIQYYPEDSLQALQCMTPLRKQLMMGKTIHPLDKHHHMLLVGNKGQYSELPAFLQQFPVLSFKPLPHWYLEEDLLLPVLQAEPCNLDKAFAKTVASFWLTITAKTSWTPRNLESILLRFALYRQHLTPLQAATISAFDELENNLDVLIKKSLQDFLHTQWPGLKDYLHHSNHLLSIRSPAFTLTDCRKNMFRIILNQIKQDQLKIQYKALQNLTAFPGLLLEGPSGTGKSHTIIKALELAGFQNGALTDKKPDIPCYYFISSENNREMQKERNQALTPLEKHLTDTVFHQGHWLVIDELNTMPSLKKILKAFLSGFDLSGKPATKPGFRLLATQNPVSFLGRDHTEKEDFFFIKTPEYSKPGLQQIGEDKGLNPRFANTIASFFVHRKTNPQSLREVNTRDFLDKIQEIKPVFFARLPEAFMQHCLHALDEKDKRALGSTSTVCHAVVDGFKSS